MNATPPPGWYPDNVGTGQRYWDGQQWTEHTAPTAVAPPVAHASSAPVSYPSTATGPSSRNWFVRHKITSGVLAFVVLMFIVGALSGPEEPAAVAADGSTETTSESGVEVDAAAEEEPEPVDSDGDGVYDEDDYAPEDRKVQTRDDVDTDKDGVADYKDAFPKNPKYSKDVDGDGVADPLDDFPQDARYSVDTDGDGVADSKDAFPRDASRSKVTLAMQNALSAARDYLDFSAFSRQGLIDQLSSNYGSGFKVEDATWAVDQLNTDWKEQAVRAAKEYLDFSPFSRQGLIDQLSSAFGSKFTVEEATYAVNKIGL
jgi:hypothetical protein